MAKTSGYDGSLTSSYMNSAALLLGVCNLTALVIISTPKSGITSLPRYAFPAIVVAVGNQLLKELSGISTSLCHQATSMGISAICLMQCCNFLAISRLDVNDLARANVFQSSDSFLRKVIRTTGLIFNLRGVGTPWQAKKLSAFPRFYSKQNNGQQPTAGWFIVRQVLIVAWQYLFLNILDVSALDTPPEDTEKLFAQGSEYLYLDATVEQWIGRVIVGPISWAISARVVLDLPNRVLSVVSVLLGITSPQEWPPVFGSVLDSYTIRGFWSTFWHQYCRWGLTSISNFICRDLLRIPRPSLVERYLNITMVFLASGLFHVVTDTFNWAPPYKLPTMAFFGAFAIGIMIEDAVQVLCRQITGVNTRDEKQRVPLWHKLVGYVWVSLWLTLTTSWYLYHNTRLPAEVKWLVPFSLVDLIGAQAANVLLLAGGWIGDASTSIDVKATTDGWVKLVRESEEKHKDATPKLKIGRHEIIWKDYAKNVVTSLTAIGDIAVTLAPAPSSAIWSGIKVLIKASLLDMKRMVKRLTRFQANVAQCEDLLANLGCTDIVLSLARRGRVYEEVYTGESPSTDVQEDLKQRLVRVKKKCLEFLAFVDGPFAIAQQGYALIAPDYAGQGCDIPQGFMYESGALHAHDTSFTTQAARKALGGLTAWRTNEREADSKKAIGGFLGAVSLAIAFRPLSLIPESLRRAKGGPVDRANPMYLNTSFQQFHQGRTLQKYHLVVSVVNWRKRYNGVGPHPLAAPMLVVQGEADISTYPELGEEDFNKTCTEYPDSTAEFLLYPGLDLDAAAQAGEINYLRCINARFEHVKLSKGCSRKRVKPVTDRFALGQR
ncbi:hypothetical protein FSARC_7012 [Fusarium sarcochroum]|uniref:Wax synthase domain-containing protein n=1 Tax=Fusarium sarcochroum TaxID=1208366 RepID=A0A8H4TW15_9HYPO|nr:hypothetical protein FSARC_7012 [Fusarium sarcochroum]